MEPLMLDGNAIGGLLQDVFATEMTTAIGTCGSCGAAEPVGAIHVFRGAGVLLRCPRCGNALMTIVHGEGSRVWLGFPGVRALQLVMPTPAGP